MNKAENRLFVISASCMIKTNCTRYRSWKNVVFVKIYSVFKGSNLFSICNTDFFFVNYVYLQIVVSFNDNQPIINLWNDWYTSCTWLLINESIWWHLVFCFRTKHKAFQYICKELTVSKRFFCSLKSQSKKTYKTLIEMTLKIITKFFLINRQILTILIKFRMIIWVNKKRTLTDTKISWRNLTYFCCLCRKLGESISKH